MIECTKIDISGTSGYKIFNFCAKCGDKITGTLKKNFKMDKK